MNSPRLIISLILIICGYLFPFNNSKESASPGISSAIFLAGAAYFNKTRSLNRGILRQDRVFYLDKAAFHFHWNRAAGISDCTIDSP
jgi:hypothetical protein